MNFNSQLLFCTCSIFVLLFQHANSDTSNKMDVRLVRRQSNGTVSTARDPNFPFGSTHDAFVTWRNTKGDERPLNEILQNTTFAVNETQSYSFDQISNSIKSFKVWTDQNLIIGGNVFGRMKNLEKVEFEPDSRPLKNKTLDISPGTFKENKLLKDILLTYFVLTNNTVKAFDDLKDTVENLDIQRCHPDDLVFKLVSQFTKLKSLRVVCTGWGGSPPRASFAKSLESIRVMGCNTQKIATTTFRGMNKLKELDYSFNNITKVENRAFDDLVNLSRLDLSYNNITQLPDGLFDKTRALKRVILCETGIIDQGVAQVNFTYCVARGRSGARKFVILPGR